MLYNNTLGKGRQPRCIPRCSRWIRRRCLGLAHELPGLRFRDARQRRAVEAANSLPDLREGEAGEFLVERMMPAGGVALCEIGWFSVATQLWSDGFAFQKPGHHRCDPHPGVSEAKGAAPPSRK